MQLFLLQSNERGDRRLEREEQHRKELEELRRQEAREREESKGDPT